MKKELELQQWPWDEAYIIIALFQNKINICLFNKNDVENVIKRQNKNMEAEITAYGVQNYNVKMMKLPRAWKRDEGQNPKLTDHLHQKNSKELAHEAANLIAMLLRCVYR